VISWQPYRADKIEIKIEIEKKITVTTNYC
jgi:hypothetical protein